MRYAIASIIAATLLIAFSAFGADYSTPIYMEQGGARQVVGTGGTLWVTTGTLRLDNTSWLIDGTTVTATATQLNNAGGGSFSTVDINAGTIDGAVIGGASAAAGTFTTLTGTTVTANSALKAPTSGLYINNVAVTASAAELNVLDDALVIGDVTDFASGTVNVANGETTAVVTLSGVTASSIVVVTPQAQPNNAVYVKSAVPGTGTFTINVSGDPGAAWKLGYFVKK